VPSSGSGSVLGSMPGSVLENELGGVLGSVLAVYLGVSCELAWERKSSRLGVSNRVQSGVYFRAYLGACNEVHLAALLNAA
jgi:hypothetical protein